MVYSTGRRKESIAKVWVSSGTGLITVNKKKFEDYFKDNALRMIINQPLEAAKKTDSIDISDYLNPTSPVKKLNLCSSRGSGFTHSQFCHYVCGRS